MIPLTPNPKTGFLESNRNSSFDSAQKTKFIELATRCAENKQMPDIPALCKALDINTFTFWRHKAQDEVFHAAWDEVMDICEAALVDVMYVNGQKPNGYMDRITWLRAHKGKRWNPDQRLTINADSPSAKGVLEGAYQVYDAEIVPNQPAIAPQAEEKR